MTARAADRERRRSAAHRKADAIVAFGLDVALAEVACALSRAGLRSLVLKGPAIASWLYDDPADRAYGDIDLLVDPARFAQAESVLGRLGFEPVVGPLDFERDAERDYQNAWSRSGRLAAKVELHRTLSLAWAAPARVWSVMSEKADQLVVAGQAVEVPSVPGRLVVVVLHALHHGMDVHQAMVDHVMADLVRALSKAKSEDWRAAADLATEIEATDAFAAGLRLDPRGVEVADALGLPTAGSRRLSLRLLALPDTTFGFERLFTAGGFLDRVRLMARECVPSRAFMRRWKPIARRGRLGLTVAYVWRPFWLMWKAPSGLLTWRKVARQHRRGSSITE